jgi:hypothetical protein
MVHFGMRAKLWADSLLLVIPANGIKYTGYGNLIFVLIDIIATPVRVATRWATSTNSGAPTYSITQIWIVFDAGFFNRRDKVFYQYKSVVNLGFCKLNL